MDIPSSLYTHIKTKALLSRKKKVCLEPVYCEKLYRNRERVQSLSTSKVPVTPTSFTMLELCLSSDGDLNLDTSVDVDNDLLDDLGGGVEAIRNIAISDDNFRHSQPGEGERTQ